MPFPGPACLAAATLPYLFSREFTIYGGNIASTMAGEFSFSICLSLALVFLGLVARGLDNGRHRALGRRPAGRGGLCHILPLFFAIGGAVVLTAHAPRIAAGLAVDGVPVLVIGGALIAFWALPFYFRLPYATDMGYEKLTNYAGTSFPARTPWLFVLAITGFLLSLAAAQPGRDLPRHHGGAAALVFRYRPPGPAVERPGPALLVPVPLPAGRRGVPRGGPP